MNCNEPTLVHLFVWIGWFKHLHDNMSLILVCFLTDLSVKAIIKLFTNNRFMRYTKPNTLSNQLQYFVSGWKRRKRTYMNNIEIPIQCYFLFSRYCLTVLLQQYIFIIYTDILLLYFYILALLCNLIIHNRYMGFRGDLICVLRNRIEITFIIITNIL